LRAPFARLHPGDYLALLAYVNRSERLTKMLQELRAAILAHKHVATCLGFGPQFLHSTGQAYKGGAKHRCVLQITAAAEADIKIPGRHIGFAVVEGAQARGDFNGLCARGRRLLRVHLAHDITAGIDALSQAAKRALT
jgi:transaldolase / glucose-6-phosphate isomerase